jgi:hypothetical protein
MIFVYLAYGIPAAFVVLGIVFAVLSLRARRQAFACAGWPTTPGQILSARINTEIEDNLTASDEGDSGNRHRPPEDVMSGATIRYTYRVGGRDYQSTRLCVGRPVLSGNPRDAEAIVAKYPANAQVSIHYNPSNPAEAMLEPLNLISAYVLLLGALGFGGMGLVALSAAWSVVQ